MFIRNSQTEMANVADISEISKISETSGTNKTKENIIFENLSGLSGLNEFKNNKKILSFGGLSEYFANRKSYIFVIVFVFIVGIIAGGFMINKLDLKETYNLCDIIDKYFANIDSIDMTARIVGNIGVNLAFVLGIYLFGATVFAPLVCCAFGLYKGLSGGFTAGIYIIGSATNFHNAICVLNSGLYIFIMIFFALACAESMSFSGFLFKNEESFKASMSFKNISVYSSRFLLLSVLIALATVLQTIIIPLAYSFLA